MQLGIGCFSSVRTSAIVLRKVLSLNMVDWAADEFMREWDKTYVSTNLPLGAKEYDEAVFKAVSKELEEDEILTGLSSEILVRSPASLRVAS